MIEQARVIVLQNCWTEGDLKAMTDITSRMYALTVEKGIPKDLARSLGIELSKYKPRHRYEKEQSRIAATQLIGLTR